MNILLLDDDNSIEDLLNYYIEMEQEWSYFDMESFLSNPTLTYFDIDIIVVDYLKERYKKLLDEITSQNKAIRTIVVSDKLEYSVVEGCDYCENNYKRRRLLKPIEPKTFYELIKKFDSKDSRCEFYQSFQNIKNILPAVVKRFLYLKYDEVNNTVVSINESQNSRYTYELVSFINILEKNNIRYKIDEEYTIKLY